MHSCSGAVVVCPCQKKLICHILCRLTMPSLWRCSGTQHERQLVATALRGRFVKFSVAFALQVTEPPWRYVWGYPIETGVAFSPEVHH